MIKKMYLSKLMIIIVLCSLWFSSNAQWTRQDAPRGRMLYGVHMVDFDEYLVVGGSPRNDSLRVIYKTYNDGAQWDILKDINAPWFQDLHFPSNQIGYAVGFTGIIEKTTDGGDTWTPFTNLPSGVQFRSFNGVHFINDNVGYVVGGNDSNDSIQTILKTTDGGANWSVQRDNLGYWLNEVYAVDANTAYAVGKRGVVLKTTDGGSNWNLVTVPGNIANRSLNSAYFHSANEGVIVGGNESNDSIRTIIRTTDGGANWSILSDNLGPWLNDVNFLNPTTGYAVGDRGDVLKTTDGGANWNLENIAVNDTFDLYAIGIYSPNFFMFVGQFSKMLVYLDVNPALPTIITESASNVTETGFKLNGTANANGSGAALSFDYGTTLAFGNNVAGTPDSATGNNNVSYSATLSGLSPALYYYRAKGESAGGAVYGDTMQVYLDNSIPNWDFEYWDTASISGPQIWGYMGEVSQTTSYNGTSAVRITGGSLNDVGVILLGSFGNGGPEGGVPFTERPDSIKGHFNYDIQAGDTAALAIFLKNNGTYVCQNIFQIYGSTGGSFVEHAFELQYQDPASPDSMILGVISSNVFGGSTNPLSVITVDDLTFVGATATIPNGNFELWDTLIGVYLASWEANNMANFPFAGQIMFVEQTTDRVHGDYAVKLKNDTSNTQWGTTITAESNNGFPVNIRHNSLHGYFKWAPQGTDTLNVNLSINSNGNVIGNANLFIVGAVNEWTAFEAEIDYFDPNAIPDTAVIRIQLGNQASGNSVAYFDYLSFDGLRDTSTIIIGVEDDLVAVIKNIYYKVYPNPTNGIVNLEFFASETASGLAEVRYTIFDVTGKQVFNELGTELTNNGVVKKQFDITGLPSGTYLLNITDSKVSKTIRFVLE